MALGKSEIRVVTEPAPPAPDPTPPPEFRWQAFFRFAREPLFMLSRHRRLLFANPAWEACTGLSLADVRGRPCRRRGGEPSLDPEEATLAALAPPAEAMAGQTCRVRRRNPRDAADWWRLEFFPLLGGQGLLGVLGKVTALPGGTDPASTLPDRLLALRDRQAEAYRLDALPGELPAMRRLIEQARLASQGRMPVTLVGEPGTGKHWLARAIHHAGPTRDRSFAGLDARLPPAVLAGLLFESAGRRLALGTVYLREPAELPRDLQDRLAQQLRGADEAGAGPRLIVGHRADPSEAVRAGRLQPELHCAASTLTIHLPPLRERLADLDGLIELFLGRARRAAEHHVAGPNPEAVQILRGHAWPGNLRELYETLRGACARAAGERLEPADLPFALRHAPLPAEKKLPLDALLEQAERRLILLALRLARGNKTRAAELLGIWRPRLLRRLEHFGIDTGDEEKEGPVD
jgi:transcriptional regulator with PAS, ATPase and Fis domain